MKTIKSSDTWSFQNLFFDEKNTLKSDFDDIISVDSARDGLNEFTENEKILKRPQPLVTVKDIWEWLLNFPLRRRRTTTTKMTTSTTTTTTSTTTEMPLQNDSMMSIGKTRRPVKYKRTCK